jgi:hypothetical protein
MNLPSDIEQMIAEGRIIEVADQIGRNAGRIDFLEGNVYGAGIEKWRQMLKNMLATLDDLLVVNFWKVFETAYREGSGVEHGTSGRDQ